MVITISREAECGGEEIAELLCQQASLKLADRGILERIAEREGLPITQFAPFDESLPGPIEAVIAEWRTSVSHGIYLRNLVQALLALEREDDVVIVGRGAAFVLTDPGTLHVRIVAPMPCRVAQVVQKRGLPRLEAERLLQAQDQLRARYVRQSFNADVEDPNHYDVTINTAELSPEEACEVILLAARHKYRRRAGALEAPHDFATHMMRFRRKPPFPRVSEVTWRLCQRRVSSNH